MGQKIRETDLKRRNLGMSIPRGQRNSCLSFIDRTKRLTSNGVPVDRFYHARREGISPLGQKLKNSEACRLLVESKGVQPIAWQHNSVHLYEEKECFQQGRYSSRRLLHPETTENNENSTYTDQNCGEQQIWT
jgi:hypothetical protein